MIKIIESFYDEESGCSYIKLETELGHFDGYAWLNMEEDAEIGSSYFGCELAEMRALERYYLRKKELLGQKLNTLYGLRADFKKCVSHDCCTFKILNNRIHQTEIQNKQYKNIIHNIRKAICNRPQDRIDTLKDVENILKKVNKKRQDNK